MSDGTDAIWKALSDPTRRAILDFLRDGPRTTSEIVEQFPHLSRFGVMKHIDVLREAGLVLTREEGRKRINSLNAIPIRQIYERWVSKYSEYWATTLTDLKDESVRAPPLDRFQIKRKLKMNAIEFIKANLATSKDWALGLLSNMKESPLQQPTSAGGNHPLWIIGHLAISESFLLDECILGKPNRFENWKGLFGPGSTPSNSAEDYPKMDELFAALESARADSLAHLETISEDDLDSRSHAPEEYGPMFATVGGCYGAMITHVMYHSGQAADARRAAGKPPLFL